MFAETLPATTPDECDQVVAPVITASYKVKVVSLDGCFDSDVMTMQVEKDDAIYVPNVLTPNGDCINDRLVIGTRYRVNAYLNYVNNKSRQYSGSIGVTGQK